MGKINKNNDVSPLQGKENDSIELFPLSEDDALNTVDPKKYAIYKKYLNEAFCTERIRNIGVTGHYGSGKSSILHTFDKEYNNGTKRFLYVSLGDYAKENNNPKSDERCFFDNHTESGERVFSDIEFQLLLQIYSRFEHKDIPASSFQYLPRYNEKKTALWLKLFMLLIFCTLLLIFHLPLGMLVRSIFPQLAMTIKIVHLFLYGLDFSICIVLFYHFLHRIIPRLHISSFSISSHGVDAKVKSKNELGYLDIYSMDLVYCLKTVCEQIAYTVVLEDMDRLNEEDCLAIITRMRELNHLINSHLQQEGKRQCIRFVYVVNDKITARLNSTKFFDYVIPVLPTVNVFAVQEMLTRNLKKLNIIVYNNTSAFSTLDMSIDMTFATEIASYMRSYRVQYAILNEFAVLKDIYCSESRNSAGSFTMTPAEQIMALAIYKVLWPRDYSDVFYGKSKILPFCNIEQDEWETYTVDDVPDAEKLLKYLTDPSHPYLNYRTLEYMGFNIDESIAIFIGMVKEMSEEQIVQIIRQMHWQDGRYFEYFLDIDSDLSAAKKKVAVKTAIETYVSSNWPDTIGKYFFKGKKIHECVKFLDTLYIEDSILSAFFKKVCPEENRVVLDLYDLKTKEWHSTGLWTNRERRIVGQMFENKNAEIMDKYKNVTVKIDIEGRLAKLVE